jgi:UDP-GlcNAc:undecaprenyl-phosphate GlcNAc-1-phosphate transferase
MSYLLTFVFSFILSVGLIPLILRISRKRGWYDGKDARKLHEGDIPRLGGVGMAIGFFVSIIAVYSVFAAMGRLPSVDWRFWAMLGIGAGFHVLGLLDDFLDLRARLKFLVQVALALAVVVAGFGFTIIEVPFSPYIINLGILGPPITLLWIVGICNAINLMDGIDGLAGGVTFIAAAIWAVLFYKNFQYLPAMVATAAGGAILGFLFFNFPPANIFMGDSGSLLLGFILAVLPLLGGKWNQGTTGLLTAVTICFVPIMDTIAAVIRRWRAGLSFFTPDRFHVHHKLLNLGFSTRQVLAIVYALCVLAGASALCTIYLRDSLAFVFMVLSWALIGIFFIILHFLKENEVKLINRPDGDRKHFGDDPGE